MIGTRRHADHRQKCASESACFGPSLGASSSIKSACQRFKNLPLMRRRPVDVVITELKRGRCPFPAPSARSRGHTPSPRRCTSSLRMNERNACAFSPCAQPATIAAPSGTALVPSFGQTTAMCSPASMRFFAVSYSVTPTRISPAATAGKTTRPNRRARGRARCRQTGQHVLVAERLNQRRQHGEARPETPGFCERDPAAQAAFQQSAKPAGGLLSPAADCR